MQTNLVKVFNHTLFKVGTETGWNDRSRLVIDTCDPGDTGVNRACFPMTLKKEIFGIFK